jgi:hypothetical protein
LIKEIQTQKERKTMSNLSVIDEGNSNEKRKEKRNNLRVIDGRD